MKVFNFSKIVLKNTNYFSARLYSSNKTVNLSYDLTDKYNSPQALVIAHGLFASKENWRSLAKRINEQTKQKVYTVDLRNHGDSRPYMPSHTYIDLANDLQQFVNDIVIDKDKCDHITLMGHSMGGKTVMSMVLNDPVGPIDVDKIIVADISPSVSPSLINIKSYLDKMRSIDMNELATKIVKARKQVDEQLCQLPSLKKDIHQRQFLLTKLKEQNGKIMWNFNLEAIINHYQDIMNFPEFNNQFHSPTLFLGGEYSEYVTKKDIPIIEKYFTDYKFVTIPKAGHVIHFDNPIETIRAINNFIN
ncbi:unnamed protein product [Brachionus calyciflorus]|uniref:sn-1-specific diacylglycerol lipase ABHD11 n=1 Tax=Brachionus calyciflorus TaxID=104777 RepID=A0A814HUH2_9BILA|nr:unnamed protein product [Brachionus calyciflorus]